MKILTFESSCDETAVAVVENGRDVLGYSVASSLDLHAQTGGVVPEVAAREHAVKINAVMDDALSQAGMKLEEVDAIAATAGPGLLSSLLTGFLHAKTLATFLDKPFVPVHHILAHVYANFLERDESEIKFPVVCLTVSGGHNELLLFKNHFEFEVLGRTRDDASGEAFDKVGRMLGLGYPGGPAVSKAAAGGTTGAVKLPVSWLNESTKKDSWDGKNYDFSFSGLKSAVRRVVEEKGELSEQDVCDIAFSFQESVCEVLSEKLVGAGKKYGAAQVWIAGGVSANGRLREMVAEKSEMEFLMPKQFRYCTDNGAMIGACAYFQMREGVVPKVDDASPSLSMDLFKK